MFYCCHSLRPRPGAHIDVAQVDEHAGDDVARGCWIKPGGIELARPTGGFVNEPGGIAFGDLTATVERIEEIPTRYCPYPHDKLPRHSDSLYLQPHAPTNVDEHGRECNW